MFIDFIDENSMYLYHCITMFPNVSQNRIALQVGLSTAGMFMVRTVVCLFSLASNKEKASALSTLSTLKCTLGTLSPVHKARNELTSSQKEKNVKT